MRLAAIPVTTVQDLQKQIVKGPEVKRNVSLSDIEHLLLTIDTSISINRVWLYIKMVHP